MGCPPVRGDNPQALASGLSYVQVVKHGITNLYHLHQCRPCTSRDICAKVGKGGIRNQTHDPCASQIIILTTGYNNIQQGTGDSALLIASLFFWYV